MLGLELADPSTRAARPDLAAAVCAGARERGVLLARSGPEENVIRVLPPLTMADDELDLALEAVGEALRASGGGRAARHLAVA